MDFDEFTPEQLDLMAETYRKIARTYEGSKPFDERYCHSQADRAERTAKRKRQEAARPRYSPR